MYGGKPRRHGAWMLALAIGVSDAVQAQASAPVTTLPGVVAVGTPMPEAAPASVDAVDFGVVPVPPQVSVSEVLRQVPGVAARDRHNLAQDVQVTIRGVGARSTFGVRGLRIYADGMPASLPDGQGQVSQLPLTALAGVEVLRGPFSALYGNASGGVIQFFSKAPAAVPASGMTLARGGDGLERLDLAWSGPWSRARGAAAGGYRIDAGRLDSKGYRRHSRARRDIGQARLTFVSAAGMHFALTANGLRLAAQDPQGLTRTEVRDDPRAANAGALAFGTRKTVRQRQLGVRLERELGVGKLAFGAHAGRRLTWQMLALPVAAQRAAGSGGGVVDLDRDYDGIDARWNFDTHLADAPFALAVGGELQRASERRRGFENFAGDVLGMRGRLRRDQRDRSAGRDGFAEARWRFAPRWQLTAGLRHSLVTFDSLDHFIAPGNPDDSGGMDYAFTSPAAGLLLTAASGLDLYANAGRGFETPSAAELAYRPDAASGLNTALRPSRSTQVEIGMRLRLGARRLGLATFDGRTRDELMVASNTGGRSTYRNAATTRRRGWEGSAAGPLGRGWHYALAATVLDARFGATAGGRHIPGTARRSGWVELRWAPVGGTTLAVALNGSSRMPADDANSAWAPGQVSIDLTLEHAWQTGGVPLVAGWRLDNVLDRRTIGSVIVNASGGGYFEPAPGRRFLFTLGIGHAATDRR